MDRPGPVRAPIAPMRPAGSGTVLCERSVVCARRAMEVLELSGGEITTLRSAKIYSRCGGREWDVIPFCSAGARLYSLFFVSEIRLVHLPPSAV